eukprot:307189-Chlamydomonas_euryale.AAC.2
MRAAQTQAPAGVRVWGYEGCGVSVARRQDAHTDPPQRNVHPATPSTLSNPFHTQDPSSSSRQSPPTPSPSPWTLKATHPGTINPQAMKSLKPRAQAPRPSKPCTLGPSTPKPPKPSTPSPSPWNLKATHPRAIDPKPPKV